MALVVRSTLLVAGTLLAAVAAGIWLVPHWVVQILERRYPGCLYQVPTSDSLLAFTFDDGPDSVSTPLILTELRRQGARATFFFISSRLHNQDRLVRRVVEDKHEIGNHFTRDSPSIRLEPDAFESDLRQAHQALERFGPLVWARPASGWYSEEMVGTMERHGYRCALGSIYPFDVAIPSVAWATRYILRNARPGGIVILHEGGGRGRRTAEVLARVLPQLRARGYRLVSLSELHAARDGEGGRPHRRTGMGRAMTAPQWITEGRSSPD